MKFQSWLVACALLVAAGCSPSTNVAPPVATEQPSVEPPPTVAEDSSEPSTESEAPAPETLFAEVKTEYDKAYEEFLDAYRSADKSARQEVMKLMPNADDYSARFMDIAKSHPGTEAAVDSLIWISSNVRGADSGTARTILFDDYTSNSKVASVVLMMSRNRNAEAQLRPLLDSELAPIQAAARYALGSILVQQDHTDQEGIALLQSVVDEFADTEISYGRRSIKIAPKAAGELTEATKLQVGMVAPVI